MRSRDFGTLLLLSLPLGFLSSVLAVLFHYAIVEGVQLFSRAGSLLSHTSDSIWLATLLLPALGGLLVGVLLYVTKAPEVAGEGVPAVHKACTHNGHIRTRVLFLKPLASIITLSSGGSAGREGPIIQIGAALGSVIGQRLRLEPEEMKTLLIAGACGAMAATFGTPLAALFFAFEVLRRDTKFKAFLILISTIVVSSASALYIFSFQGLQFGGALAPSLGLFEYVLIIVLGIIGGLCAVGFGTTLSYVGKFFDRLPIPRILMPAVGGLLVGFLTLFVPVLPEHASYPLMNDIVSGTTLPVLMALLIIAAKILATALTIESGGSGGIFAPLLLIGVLMGSAFGNSLETILGLEPLMYEVFPLLGMAALLSGAAHAPLTAIVMVLEMSDQINLLVPLVLVAYVAFAITKLFNARSLYHHSRVKEQSI